MVNGLITHEPTCNCPNCQRDKPKLLSVAKVAMLLNGSSGKYAVQGYTTFISGDDFWQAIRLDKVKANENSDSDAH